MERRQPIQATGKVVELSSSGFYWVELPNGYRARGYSGKGIKADVATDDLVRVEFSAYDMSQARIIETLD
tara:strand:+ start:6763 stop:6972 length:210 start_codon:yes stop_codon:yes gene_type:complete